MEQNTNNQSSAVNQVYDYAANLIIHGKKSDEEVIEALIQQGVDKESALVVVENLHKQITLAKKERAKKDMLYGALWCVGGIIATIADIGFIFWGAIVFGAVQFFKGVANA